MRFTALTFLLLTLTACSAYENSGRKYLEKSAYTLAGLKLHEKLIGCAAPARDASWRSTDATDPRAPTFVRDTAAGFELRVEPRADYACDYIFATAEDRERARDLAIEAALSGGR